MKCQNRLTVRAKARGLRSPCSGQDLGKGRGVDEEVKASVFEVDEGKNIVDEDEGVVIGERNDVVFEHEDEVEINDVR